MVGGQRGGLPGGEGFGEVGFDLGGDEVQVQGGAHFLLTGAGEGGTELGIAGERGDAGGEFGGIAGWVSEGVLTVAEQLRAAAGEGADDGQAGGHGFQGREGEGFLPFGGEEQGVMGAIHVGHLLGRGVMEGDGQVVPVHVVAQQGFVGGLAFAIDVEGAIEVVADLAHGFQGGEDAFVLGEAAGEEEFAEGLGGRGDGAVVALGIDRAVDDRAMSDGVASALGEMAEA